MNYKITTTFNIDVDSLQEAEAEADRIIATVVENHIVDWEIESVELDDESQEDDD